LMMAAWPQCRYLCGYAGDYAGRGRDCARKNAARSALDCDCLD
jgi:hypothetical protein